MGSNSPGQERAPSRWTRPWQGIRWVVILIGIGFAVHLLTPQVGELEQAGPTIRSGSWWWLAVAAAASAATYPATAVGIRGSASQSLPFGRTTLVQLATSATTVMAPAGLGAVALNQSYLEEQGVPRAEAVAGLSLNLVIAGIVHVAAMVATATALGLSLPTAAGAPSRRFLVDGAVVLAVLAGVLMWWRPVRRRLIREVISAGRTIRALVGEPVRAAQLFGGALLVNAAYIASLQACIAAFGPAPGIGHTAFVYLVAAVVGTVTPTPGGVGGYEAALVGGLTRIGPAAGPAVAAALGFRLLTFWLPIVPGAIALRFVRRAGSPAADEPA